MENLYSLDCMLALELKSFLINDEWCNLVELYGLHKMPSRLRNMTHCITSPTRAWGLSKIIS